MKSEASNLEASDIFNSANQALNNGRKKAQEVLAEIEVLQKKHASILANNAGLEAMVDAATSAVSKAKGQKTAAKAAPKAAKKAAAAKASAPKAAKIDGRSKEARAAKKAAAAKAGGAPVIDGRSKEARAAKASAPKAAKIDGRSKEARAAKKAAAKASKKTPAAAKKTAKKAAATAKATTSTESNTSNAAEGRRAVARGDRPPMKEAMALVMGKAKMGAAEVVTGLEKKGWTPNAEDPQQYVSYMLSSNKDVFERLERGVYRVYDGVVFTKKTKAAKGNGDTAAKKPAAASSKKTNDEELEELGIKGGANIASNPFT